MSENNDNLWGCLVILALVAFKLVIVGMLLLALAAPLLIFAGVATGEPVLIAIAVAIFAVLVAPGAISVLLDLREKRKKLAS